MLDQLQNPPPYFQDAIRAHFRLRGDAALATCRRWVEWCRERNQAGPAAQIERLLPQLEAELGKLQQQ